MKLRSICALAATAALLAPAARAWDYEGHRMVNGVALQALPADFPEFVRTPANAERIKFLAGEPDRWRNDAASTPMQQATSMDHYLDAEDIPAAGLRFDQLPAFRYDFAVEFAQGRAAHLSAFPPFDPAKDKDHTREWCGFLPWAITEYYGKLRSGFAYLKALQERGTPEEIANAEANIVYVMGVMGHFVGDAAQPLHVTVHHHGWVGPNPHGYTTWPGLHSWIDGGFIAKAGVKPEELVPLTKPAALIPLTPQPNGRDPVFGAVLDYVLAQAKLVEPLYALEKAGKLGHHEQPILPEGRTFVDGQLVKGGEMLAALWLTAWKTAPADTYLSNQLANRAARAKGLMPPPPSPLPAPRANK